MWYHNFRMWWDTSVATLVSFLALFQSKPLSHSCASKPWLTTGIKHFVLCSNRSAHGTGAVAATTGVLGQVDLKVNPFLHCPRQWWPEWPGVAAAIGWGQNLDAVAHAYCKDKQLNYSWQLHLHLHTWPTWKIPSVCVYTLTVITGVLGTDNSMTILIDIF